MEMAEILDLDRFPIDDLDGPQGRELIAHCQEDLERRGLFNLAGLVRPAALEACLAEILPTLETEAHYHSQWHNIYFLDGVAGLDPDHPALRRAETCNSKICADQMADSLVCRIYEWPPLAAFLARVMGKPRLHVMADPLARVNVMTYTHGQALNWHFDRSEFTTTLLLQAPKKGGAFQYRPDLRSDDDPNYDGVARLLAGQDDQVHTLPLTAGTLNVFKGKNTAHRVTPPEGDIPRTIAVFSYYEQPGVRFGAADQLQFYGRTEAAAG